MEKIEAYTKTKPVSANQSSSVPTNSKPPIVPLKTTTQKNIGDFMCTSPKFKTVIPITNQNKQSSFTQDLNNISNPGIKTIVQAPCLTLASENKCETPKIVAIDAFIDELIEGKEAVATVDCQTEDSIRKKTLNLAVYHLLMFLDLMVILTNGKNSFITLKSEFI